jgi:hypothetical protein
MFESRPWQQLRQAADPFFIARLPIRKSQWARFEQLVSAATQLILARRSVADADRLG